LRSALGEGTEVRVEFTSNGEKYRARRTFSRENSDPKLEREADGSWIKLDDNNPGKLISIAAYSQGEILEYARQPVGRVGLIDAHLDLSYINEKISTKKSELEHNSKELIAARKAVEDLQEQAAATSALAEHEAELSSLFDDDLVKNQSIWSSER